MLRLIISPLLLIAISAQISSLYAQQHRIKRIQREQHTFNKGIVKTDSVVFYYPGNRSGQITWQWAENLWKLPTALYSAHATLQYDSMLSKIDHSATPSGPTGTYRSSQRFNSLAWIMDYNLYLIDANGNTTLEIEQKNTYTGGKIGQTLINKDKYNYYYKNGLLDRMLFRPDYSPSSWPITLSYYYSYDQAGNLKQVLRTSTGTLPSYDSVWTLYNYDTQNRLIEEVTIDYSMGAQKDTSHLALYTHDANGDMVQEDHYDGYFLDLTTRRINTYNNQHNKTEFIQIDNRFSTTIDTQFRIKFAYDGYNLLTKLENEKWINGQWIPAADSFATLSSYTYTFEYEVAWPTGVPEVKDAAGVKLYPSPASDFIRVETEWKDAKPFTAAIVDMQGRMIRHWEEPATKNYARTIPLTELPAGMYLIKLHCGDEQLTKQFAVYK